MNNTAPTRDLRGWVGSPDGRGTLDIVWSCIFTILLCIWTSVCSNIPATTDTRWNRLKDKIDLATVGLLGPEFLVILAGGQWQSARRSVRMFHAEGYKDWTIRHAFFTDMGGFLLQTSDFPLIPIDARQLYYLVKKGYLEYPLISEESIDDRNKADGLTRIFTVIQVMWFTTSTLSRVVLRVSITTLELTTLGFIFCMFITSYLWWHKPYEISQAMVLRSNTSLAEILSGAGDAARHPYQHTPLDFISHEEWSLSLFWTYYINIVQKAGIPIFARPVKSRPYDRIPTINWPMPHGFLPKVVCGLLSTTYSAIFVCGWNLSFPTNIERHLWRISSVYLTSFMPLVGLFDFYYFTPRGSKPCRHDEYKHLELDHGKLIPRQSQSEGDKFSSQNFKIMAAGLRNNSPQKDPSNAISLRVLIPGMSLCILYTCARAYIIVEDILGLRAVPASAFLTVNWSRYFPHL